MYDSLSLALLQARDSALFFIRPILKKYRFTEQQWRIIFVLANQKTLDFHIIASKAPILCPNLTGILLRMQENRLIFHLKSVNNQRKLYVTLTPKGKQQVEQIQQKIKKCRDEINQRFSAQKQQALMELLLDFITITAQDECSPVSRKSSLSSM